MAGNLWSGGATGGFKRRKIVAMLLKALDLSIPQDQSVARCHFGLFAGVPVDRFDAVAHGNAIAVGHHFLHLMLGNPPVLSQALKIASNTLRTVELPGERPKSGRPGD